MEAVVISYLLGTQHRLISRRHCCGLNQLTHVLPVIVDIPPHTSDTGTHLFRTRKVPSTAQMGQQLEYSIEKI